MQKKQYLGFNGVCMQRIANPKSSRYDEQANKAMISAQYKTECDKP